MNDRNFDDLKVGDKVIVRRDRGSRTICKVAKVTPKQIKTDGDAFWKHNGHKLGNSTAWYGAYLEHWNEERAESIRATQRRNERLRQLNETSFYELTSDQLERIIAIRDEPKP